MGANVLYLKDGTRAHFMGFLEKHFPALAKKYERLYPGAYAPQAYAKEVRGIVKLLQDKYRRERSVMTRKRPARTTRRANQHKRRLTGRLTTAD